MTRMKINIHPDVKILGEALLDFVKSFGWKSVVILYQGNEGTALELILYLYNQSHLYGYKVNWHYLFALPQLSCLCSKLFQSDVVPPYFYLFYRTSPHLWCLFNPAKPWKLLWETCPIKFLSQRIATPLNNRGSRKYRQYLHLTCVLNL